MRKSGLARQADADLELALAGLPAQPEAYEGALVGIERHIHRIRRHHGGQHGRLGAVGLDQIADRDFGLADATGDRRQHAREGDVELRGFELRLRAAQGGFEFLDGSAGFIDLALRRGLRGEQLLVAGERDARQVDAGVERSHLRLGRPGLRVVGPGIDGEQQIALVDLGALLEVDALDVAGNARPDLYLLDRFETRGKFDCLGDRAGHRRGHGDLRRATHAVRWAAGAVVLLAACHQRHRNQQQHRARLALHHSRLPRENSNVAQQRRRYRYRHQ